MPDANTHPKPRYKLRKEYTPIINKDISSDARLPEVRFLSQADFIKKKSHTHQIYDAKNQITYLATTHNELTTAATQFYAPLNHQTNNEGANEAALISVLSQLNNEKFIKLLKTDIYERIGNTAIDSRTKLVIFSEIYLGQIYIRAFLKNEPDANGEFNDGLVDELEVFDKPIRVEPLYNQDSADEAEFKLDYDIEPSITKNLFFFLHSIIEQLKVASEKNNNTLTYEKISEIFKSTETPLFAKKNLNDLLRLFKPDQAEDTFYGPALINYLNLFKLNINCESAVIKQEISQLRNLNIEYKVFHSKEHTISPLRFEGSKKPIIGYDLNKTIKHKKDLDQIIRASIEDMKININPWLEVSVLVFQDANNVHNHLKISIKNKDGSESTLFKNLTDIPSDQDILVVNPAPNREGYTISVVNTTDNKNKSEELFYAYVCQKHLMKLMGSKADNLPPSTIIQRLKADSIDRSTDPLIRAYIKQSVLPYFEDFNYALESLTLKSLEKFFRDIGSEDIKIRNNAFIELVIDNSEMYIDFFDNHTQTTLPVFSKNREGKISNKISIHKPLSEVFIDLTPHHLKKIVINYISNNEIERFHTGPDSNIYLCLATDKTDVYARILLKNRNEESFEVTKEPVKLETLLKYKEYTNLIPIETIHNKGESKQIPFSSAGELIELIEKNAEHFFTSSSTGNLKKDFLIEEFNNLVQPSLNKYIRLEPKISVQEISIQEIIKVIEIAYKQFNNSNDQLYNDQLYNDQLYNIRFEFHPSNECLLHFIQSYLERSIDHEKNIISFSHILEIIKADKLIDNTIKKRIKDIFKDNSILFDQIDQYVGNDFSQKNNAIETDKYERLKTIILVLKNILETDSEEKKVLQTPKNNDFFAVLGSRFLHKDPLAISIAKHLNQLNPLQFITDITRSIPEEHRLTKCSDLFSHIKSTLDGIGARNSIMDSWNDMNKVLDEDLMATKTEPRLCAIKNMLDVLLTDIYSTELTFGEAHSDAMVDLIKSLTLRLLSLNEKNSLYKEKIENLHNLLSKDKPLGLNQKANKIRDGITNALNKIKDNSSIIHHRKDKPLTIRSINNLEALIDDINNGHVSLKQAYFKDFKYFKGLWKGLSSAIQYFQIAWKLKSFNFNLGDISKVIESTESKKNLLEEINTLNNTEIDGIFQSDDAILEQINILNNLDDASIVKIILALDKREKTDKSLQLEIATQKNLLDLKTATLTNDKNFLREILKIYNRKSM